MKNRATQLLDNGQIMFINEDNLKICPYLQAQVVAAFSSLRPRPRWETDDLIVKQLHLVAHSPTQSHRVFVDSDGIQTFTLKNKVILQYQSLEQYLCDVAVNT